MRASAKSRLVAAIWAVGLLVCVGAALFTLFAGPQRTVVCADASWPNTMFGDMLGHVDAETYLGCVVPTLGAWITALVLLFLPIAAAVLLAQLSRRRRLS